MTRSDLPVPIFIGYDSRERAATNVLIDSLYQFSSVPLAITPLVTSQLEAHGIYWRQRDPKQSTSFSFTRFLVPYLMRYQGWALFMDCDMLCLSDIKSLWDLRNDKYALMCVQHKHEPVEKVKFLGEVQTSYPKKSLSSLMLINCNRCLSLAPDSSIVPQAWTFTVFIGCRVIMKLATSRLLESFSRCL